MNTLLHLRETINRLLILVGGVFLVGMMGLTCLNIVLRGVWVPLRGTFELMGFLGAMVTAMALGYTQVKRGHIAVDVLVDHFPRALRQAAALINGTLCALFFGIAAWQVTKKAMILQQTGEVTETLRISYHPFVYAVGLGCAVLGLIFLIEFGTALFPKNATGSEHASSRSRVLSNAVSREAAS